MKFKMDYKHRFGFNTQELELTEILDSLGIAYEDRSNCGIAVVEILESDERWSTLKPHLDRTDQLVLTTPIYTQVEMENAEWYSLRSSWHWEYPQPNTDNFGYERNIIYSDNFCPECGAHKVQIGNFRIKRAPKWGRKCFLSLNWVHDVLFLNEHAKDILQSSDLNGFHFMKVLDTKGEKAIEGIYQLCTEGFAQPGIISNNDTVRTVQACMTCGLPKYSMTGRGIVYKKSAFEGICTDIVESTELFGFAHYAGRKTFINKRFYEVVVKNKLDNKLEIEPVRIV